MSARAFILCRTCCSFKLPCVDQPLDSRALVVSVLATPDAMRITPSLVHTSPASWSNTLLHTTPTYILRTSLGRLDIHLPSAAGQFDGARPGRRRPPLSLALHLPRSSYTD